MEAKKLIRTFQPLVYYHEEEKHFPVAIEWFGIAWDNLKEWNETGKLNSTYLGENNFTNKAPLYSSVLQQDNGTTRLIYYFLHGFNECGFRLHLKYRILKYSNEELVNVCPAGRHWSDVEGIFIYLNPDLQKVKKIVFNYHDFSKEYSYDQIRWINSTHPIVYSGRGSHASYPRDGIHNYIDVWKHKNRFIEIKGEMVDITGNHTIWNSENPRLLKLNGNPVSDISKEEFYLAFKFKGRLGQDWKNQYSENLIKKIKSIAKKIKIFSPNLALKLERDAEKLHDLFNKNAPYSFASKIF